MGWPRKMGGVAKFVTGVAKFVTGVAGVADRGGLGHPCHPKEGAIMKLVRIFFPSRNNSN